MIIKTKILHLKTEYWFKKETPLTLQLTILIYKYRSTGATNDSRRLVSGLFVKLLMKTENFSVIVLLP